MEGPGRRASAAGSHQNQRAGPTSSTAPPFARMGGGVDVARAINEPWTTTYARSFRDPRAVQAEADAALFAGQPMQGVVEPMVGLRKQPKQFREEVKSGDVALKILCYGDSKSGDDEGSDSGKQQKWSGSCRRQEGCCWSGRRLQQL